MYILKRRFLEKKMLLGKKVGDRFYVQVNDNYGYWAVVRAIEKGSDDGSAELNSF